VDTALFKYLRDCRVYTKHYKPFLNIYGIAGYTQNITNPNFEVHEVTLLAPSEHDGEIKYDTLITLKDTVKINDELGYYGSVYGVGATISSGYKNFFFVLDYHYTVTKPRDLEDKLESHNFSGKIGVLLGKNKSGDGEQASYCFRRSRFL